MKDIFSPGEPVTGSGVYRVVHAEHRDPHMVLVLAGDTLPACRVCGGKVSFQLEHALDYAPHDWDLAGPLTNSKSAAE